MANFENIVALRTASEMLLQPQIAEQLFDQMPETVFFIKDMQGRYQVVNQTLVERCGVKEKSEILGLTAAQVLGEDLGNRYVKQDRQVLQTSQPLIQYLELHNYQSQELGWCLTTKLPLMDANNHCIGLIGISQDLKIPEPGNDMFSNIYAAIKYVEDNLEQNPSIKKMAEIAGMSHYQLDRRMKLLYGLSAGKWLIKTRISKASHKLLETDMSILDIAFSVGYSDQSAFTKQFKKVTGLSPLKFKRINHSNNRNTK